MGWQEERKRKGRPGARGSVSKGRQGLWGRKLTMLPSLVLNGTGLGFLPLPTKLRWG